MDSDYVKSQRKIGNTADFIFNAKLVHGSRFSYERSEFRGYRTKITITCSIHGDFEQRVDSHLSGNGCRQCTIPPSNRPEVLAKRRQTFIDRYGVSHPMKVPTIASKAAHTWNIKSDAELAEIYRKKKKTYNERYGYDNPFLDKEIKTHIYKLRRKRGEWAEITDERELYKRMVWKLTERSYNQFLHMINPDLTPRDQNWHLDHILPISFGFSNAVPPFLIASPVNLQIIPASANQSKGNRLTIAYDDWFTEASAFASQNPRWIDAMRI